MSHEKNSERLERRKETPSQSDKLNREGQSSDCEEQSKMHKKMNPTNDNAQKALPNVKVTDGQVTDGAQVSDVTYLQSSNTGKMIETKDGRTAVIDYDTNGKPVRYQDFNGQTYEKQGDVWKNKANVMQPDGVNIDVDENQNVKITDKSTGIVRTNQTNGVEVTDYSSVGGGKTTRQVDGNTEWITIESKNRPMRSMKIIDDRVQSYTDGSGATYNVTNRKTNDNPPKSVFEKTNSQGQKVEGDYTVTADRSGNVVVRKPGHETDSDYATRELNNGTIVTSDKQNTQRSVIDASGNQLDPTSDAATKAQESPVVAETPGWVNLEENRRQAQAHSGSFSFGANSLWFKDQVKTGGPWDFKNGDPKYAGVDQMRHPEYEDFGNWHYGYMGAAAGFSKERLEREAGREQQNQKTSKPEWGDPGWTLNPWGGSGNYGDDPNDQKQIVRGYDDEERREAA